MGVSPLFSVSIRLRNNLIVQNQSLIETFNSYENMFIQKIEF